MKTRIKATNIELTDYLQELVDEKLEDIEKLLLGIHNFEDLIFEIELGKTSKHHQKGDIFRAEIQVQVPGGKMLRAVSEKEDFLSAIVDAKKELQVQIKKYREKSSKEKRRDIEK